MNFEEKIIKKKLKKNEKMSTFTSLIRTMIFYVRAF